MAGSQARRYRASVQHSSSIFMAKGESTAEFATKVKARQVKKKTSVKERAGKRN
jgi:hypothetical protein